MTNRNGLFEVITGTLVLLIAILFCLYAYRYATWHMRGGGYYLTISTFNNISGLSKGSDVRIWGIKVGSVVEESLDKKTLRPVVTIWVEDTIQLPRDSSAKITASGFFGKNYIALVPGGSTQFLKDGDKIVWAQGSLDLVDLISAVLFNSKSTVPSAGK